MTDKLRSDRDPAAVVPIFPLVGAILLPRGQLPLNIFEPRYLNMVDDALSSHRQIVIVQPTGEGGQKDRPAVYPIGGLGRITAFAETDDGRYLITLTGLSRIKILRELPVMTPYRQAQVSTEPFSGDRATDEGKGLDRQKLHDALKRYFTANRIESDWEAIEHAPSEALVNSLSMIAPVEPREKQALLEATGISERAQILIALIEIALASHPGDDGIKPN